MFCNPPYTNIGDWLAKASESIVSVYLLPVRTDTKWFHAFMGRMREIRFIKGRVRFGESKCGAPFPSMLCVIEGAAI